MFAVKRARRWGCAEVSAAEKLSPAILALVRALAKRAARDYLTEQSAQQHDSAAEHTNHVPLPDLGKAA